MEEHYWLAGKVNIPENKKKIAKQFLRRMDHISVRELRATEMIKELIGRSFGLSNE